MAKILIAALAVASIAATCSSAAPPADPCQRHTAAAAAYRSIADAYADASIDAGIAYRQASERTWDAVDRALERISEAYADAKEPIAAAVDLNDLSYGAYRTTLLVIDERISRYVRTAEFGEALTVTDLAPTMRWMASAFDERAQIQRGHARWAEGLCDG